MRLLTEVEMFPQQENWILESDDYDFIRRDEDTPVNWYVDPPDGYLTLVWYERPNEDNLLNTLTEALEGAYNYD